MITGVILFIDTLFLETHRKIVWRLDRGGTEFFYLNRIIHLEMPFQFVSRLKKIANIIPIRQKGKLERW